MPTALSRIIIFMCFDSFWDIHESHNRAEGKLSIKAASQPCCFYLLPWPPALVLFLPQFFEWAQLSGVAQICKLLHSNLKEWCTSLPSHSAIPTYEHWSMNSRHVCFIDTVPTQSLQSTCIIRNSSLGFSVCKVRNFLPAWCVVWNSMIIRC